MRRFRFCVRKSVFLLSIPVLISLSCNKDRFDPDPDARPAFSADTITFDTVFTTIGSATLSLKVYNRSSRPLLIRSIELAGGEDSYFRLNIDGLPTSREQDVEIPPDDSLYIFIAVTVDPTSMNNPVVIQDSVVFNTNGFLQDVKLIAYGQDVHLINGEILTTQDWNNDKPYLIYNSMAVDTGQILTIEAGTLIFLHRNSSMIIWGSLVVNGTWENPVVFQHDRQEEFYDIVAGQWGTIYLDPVSRGNRINHAIIRNSVAGIQIGYPSAEERPELELSNSMIINTSYAGIYAFGAELTCYNTVIANCAGPAAALLKGGRYRFQHVTISNQGVIGSSRTAPSVILSNVINYAEYDPSTGTSQLVTASGDLEYADFSNTIITGNLNHELQFIQNQSNLFNYRFDHCLLKAAEDSVDENQFNALILNEDARFMNDSDRYHLDFRLDTLSPAKDAGDPALLEEFPYLRPDITGTLRDAYGRPDLGAFERKEDY